MLIDFAACVLGSSAVDAWVGSCAGALAIAAHRLDRDDLHLSSVTHPGGVVWPVVVECGGEATLGEAISAAAFGYELTTRLGTALGADHRRRWHSTATAGTVGAAGAAAKLFGADPTVAIGHALSIAGGSAQAMVERSGTRLLHRSHAAVSGIACARAAASGLGASRFNFEGGRGFLQQADRDFAAILLGPSEHCALEQTGVRLHRSTGFAHAAMDAALTLAPLPPGSIAEVRVRVSPPAATALASNRNPRSYEERWWSIEHAVAVCLATGSASNADQPLDADDITRFRDKVVLEPIDSGWEATVEVRLRDGTTRAARSERPLGHGNNEVTDSQLCAKWAELTGEDGAPVFTRLRARKGTELFAGAVADVLGDLGGRLATPSPRAKKTTKPSRSL